MSKLISRGLLVVVGGALLGAERGCLNSVEVYESGKFRLLDPRLRQPRRSPAIVQQNRELFVVGGCNGSEHLNDAERLCGESISSSQLKIPNGFSCAAFCQLKDCTFIFGGFDGQDCLNQVIRIQDQEASAQTPLMTRLKNSSAISVSDNEVLLFGGWDERRTLDTVFAYQTSDGSQSFHSTLPYPIEGHTTVKHQNYVYIIGGYDGISVVTTIIQYDLITKRSKVLPAKLKIARENHISALIEEDGQPHLLIVGGWDGKQALKSCEKFKIEDHDLKLAECTLELNQPRNRPSAFLLD